MTARKRVTNSVTETKRAKLKLENALVVDKVNEFGLFVASNASNSHILFGNSNKTPCGLIHSILETRHPCSDVRFYLPHDEFKEYVDKNRHSQYEGYRFCKRCLNAFDKLLMDERAI